MSGIEISTKVLRVLEFIEKKDVQYGELINLYNNATKNKLITEIERELVTHRLEAVMMKSFPKESIKVLRGGNKNDKPVEILEEIYHTIETKFYLSENLHKNGVKVGGSMIGGRQYIAWYISYKNTTNRGASISYRQDTPEDDPRLEVSIYQGSLNPDTQMENEIQTFPIEAVSFDRSILINPGPDIPIISRSVELLCGNCHIGEDILALQ